MKVRDHPVCNAPLALLFSAFPEYLFRNQLRAFSGYSLSSGLDEYQRVTNKGIRPVRNRVV